MQINTSVTVSEREILESLEHLPYDEIIDFIKTLDEELEDWEFTVKLWHYLDELIKEYKDEYIEEMIRELSPVDKNTEGE